jgi:hypothetical protein
MKMLTPSELQALTTKQLIRYAKRQALDCIYGVVTESEDREVDGVPVTVSTVRRINRKAKMALLKSRPKNDDPAGDTSIIRTGNPGSPERLAAYADFYAANGCVDNKYDGTISPFMFNEE